MLLRQALTAFKHLNHRRDIGNLNCYLPHLQYWKIMENCSLLKGCYTIQTALKTLGSHYNRRKLETQNYLSFVVS